MVLPIPDSQSPLRYADLKAPGLKVGKLAHALTKGRVRSTSRVHLDPDLCFESVDRDIPKADWRALFGQEGAALSHLLNQGVGPGDLFLFFGLFRRAELSGNSWRFCAGSKPFHALWGWFQVESYRDVQEILNTDSLAWMHGHPHCHHQERSLNGIFMAKAELELPDTNVGLPGAGTFPKMVPAMRLTVSGSRQPSRWRLPEWMEPVGSRRPLTYHGKRNRWQRGASGLVLQSVGRGQEFVLHGEDYPEMEPWLSSLFQGELVEPLDFA